MPSKTKSEPIEPASIPGEPTDPTIPTEETDEIDEDGEESDVEHQARESEKAFDQAITRLPPG